MQIIPSLLPPVVQGELLCRLLHRDLSNERHQTNLHLHYDIIYPGIRNLQDEDSSRFRLPNDSETLSAERGSFFQQDPDQMFPPHDSKVHPPLSIRNFLNKKLRWMTLGGQYNWTDKRYPASTPPAFPRDIVDLLHGIFPTTEAEAAIVNVYSPGDRLSVHRDVSEECDKGLISISFGCDGLFMVGHENGNDCEVFRLRSGDAVYMAGTSRLAWHAVPKIMPSTCPSWLQDWPAGDLTLPPYEAAQFEQWRGWMSNKRINLNVRQMRP